MKFFRCSWFSEFDIKLHKLYLQTNYNNCCDLEINAALSKRCIGNAKNLINAVAFNQINTALHINLTFAHNLHMQYVSLSKNCILSMFR